MNEFQTNIVKRMIFAILILTVAILLVGIILLDHTDWLPFFAGTILGSGFSILRLYMLASLARKAEESAGNAPAPKVHLFYAFRFFVLIILLAGTAIWHTAALWGMAAALFTLPLAGFTMKFLKHGDE